MRSLAARTHSLRPARWWAASLKLWRYPVKSMRGGTVSQLFITDRGGLGDRAWALRDPTNGRIASAKRFPQLLEFRAIYEVEPTMTTSGRVRIEAHRMLKACTPTSHAPRS
jgi:uncharacterized protein YcbX